MQLKRLIQKLFAGATYVAVPLLSNCGNENFYGINDSRQQYVAPNTADVRGTWYGHGSSGGWFGPNQEWGFAWYYLKQYGTDVEGKYEYELYEQNNNYYSLSNLSGTITGNKMLLTHINEDGTYGRALEGTVKGDTWSNSERTSQDIVRRATPW